ncbi:simple sugar transport system permease protein [Citrobacter amalonaticus]|uniref:ABC transporter permease n=1 Tax=Citrobacter amalonaticus TaxID=35703 RepID=UPI001907D4AE|nr:ABC transporter permease [Citrobacter amalonaticus]MBJ9259784.1 ABC transporter permease [Citrobacter amalonaticus]MCP1631349.1 simple sugar transport system permease protein [Citrobacter amalonaticus]MDT7077396.1 ABC transporter permease [Citrobacter amalonaticus]
MKKQAFLPIDGTSSGLLAICFFAVVAFSLAMPGRFFTDNTFLSIAFQLPELGLLTFAMFVPMLSGGLNLAIIGTANLTSLFMAWLLIRFVPADASTVLQLGWLFLALLGAMIIAIVIGAITGVIISRVGAHPILVTLGSMTIISGIGIYLTKGAALSGMPPIVRSIGSEVVYGIPVPMVIFIVATIMLALFLGKTRTGKVIYMCGSNINATWFSGIRTDRVLIAIYALSSLLCVLAGLIMLARFNSARMGYGDSYLLLTVLAIVLGGTDPFGGVGKVGHVFCALLVLQVIATGLSLSGLSLHFNLAVWGMTLIAALAFKFFKQKWQARRAMNNSLKAFQQQLATREGR